jgi:hypothetical protein
MERLTTEDKTETRSGSGYPTPEVHGLDMRRLLDLV